MQDIFTKCIVPFRADVIDFSVSLSQGFSPVTLDPKTTASICLKKKMISMASFFFWSKGRWLAACQGSSIASDRLIASVFCMGLEASTLYDSDLQGSVASLLNLIHKNHFRARPSTAALGGWSLCSTPTTGLDILLLLFSRLSHKASLHAIHSRTTCLVFQ